MSDSPERRRSIMAPVSEETAAMAFFTEALRTFSKQTESIREDMREERNDRKEDRKLLESINNKVIALESSSVYPMVADLKERQDRLEKDVLYLKGEDKKRQGHAEVGGWIGKHFGSIMTAVVIVFTAVILTLKGRGLL